MTDDAIRIEGVLYSSELGATPEGMYRLDQIRRQHDAALAALTPAARAAVLDVEDTILFGTPRGVTP